MRREANLKWSQLALAANTPMLLHAGLVEGRLDAGVLSSGQVAGVIDDLPSVADLIGRIMNEAEQTLKRLGDLREQDDAFPPSRTGSPWTKPHRS